jgi:superfamily II DNA helicase RecQ
MEKQSTLFISPTGGGKSLCYQLPAFIFGHRDGQLTLVISPTLSLMEDQLRQLPKGLRGACWASNQTALDWRQMMADLGDNRVDVLFVSPERLTNSAFLSFFRSPAAPRIRLVCIDEVHCLSEWSHNFRPAYLLVNSVVREQLGVECILGLTGTATSKARLSICQNLGIDPQAGVIMNPVVRHNLHISVSCEQRR